MATQRTGRPSQASDSVMRQTASAVGNMIETGANLVGRGVAAGMEGAAALADRAVEMTGLNSPTTAGRAAESAVGNTASMGRSVARSTQRAASSTERVADRMKTSGAGQTSRDTT